MKYYFGLEIQIVNSVVVDAWLGSDEGSPSFSLSRKWKRTKRALKYWNQQNFGYIQSRMKSLMSDIGLIQFSPHSSVNAAREVVLQATLQEHLFSGGSSVEAEV